jgi:hypothetical protein
MMRCLVLITFAGMLAGCGDSHGEAQRRDSGRSHRARSGVRNFGRKTSDTFHRVGGHLQKFFTGRDTLSR